MPARVLLAAALACAPAFAQTKKKPAAAQPSTAPPQPQDEEYTRLIKEYLQDPRITTELVDHMPASDTVPSPLKFFGRIPGTPGELTYAKDIDRYYEALAKASPRAKFWKIGQTEEGRDQVILAIADEATIKRPRQVQGHARPARRSAQNHRGRRPSELIHTAKPIYWATSGIHSPETGGPEMLIELAYRLIVEETPFIQHDPQQRHHVHHAGDRSGRPRAHGRHLLLQQEDAGKAPAPAADVLGQVRAARQQSRRHGPVSQAARRTSPRPCSSGTPPSCTTCTKRSPISTSPPAPARTTSRSTPSPIDEWWLLGETEIMEMAKRGVPGVWTYGYLRRLGAQLSFLDRPHAQFLRPLLRSAELRSRPAAQSAACAPPPPAANGSAPIRRCPPSSGARATTPTSRNPRC